MVHRRGPAAAGFVPAEARTKAEATNILAEDAAGESPAPVPAANTDDLNHQLAAVCSGIAAEFARRIAAARQSSQPNELSAVIRALKSARGSALAAARENAKMQIAARRRAATGASARSKPQVRRPLPAAG